MHDRSDDESDVLVFGTTDWTLEAVDVLPILFYGEPTDRSLVHARLSSFVQQYSVLATFSGFDHGAVHDTDSTVHRALEMRCSQNGDSSWPLVSEPLTFIVGTSAMAGPLSS